MRKYYAVAWVVLSAVAGFLVLLGYANFVQAATIRGNQQNCMELVHVAVGVSRFRDAGMTWDIAGPRLQLEIAEVVGQPGMLVVDNEDAEYVFKTFERVWSENLPAYTMAERAYIHCMRKSV